MANLFGTGINQVPTNGMLGNLAFQDKAYVSVDRIGIGTTAVDTGTANQTLQNYGGAYVSGNTGIGTTNPQVSLDVVGNARFTGIVTATTFSGTLSGYASSAGISTNLRGGSGGTIVYQSAVDTTAFLSNGSSGQILQSNGGTNAPTWVNAAPSNAITGLTIRDEGTIVSTANSFSQLNFVGNIVSVAGTGPSGIATITFIDYVSNAGVATTATTATNVIGGIGSITQLNVSGISTFQGQIQSTQANSTADGGGQIYLNGATGNRIDFNINGVGAPAFTTRSAGTKIVLYPQVGASAVDYGLGIEGGTLWYSVPQASAGYAHRWYAGQTQLADFRGTGELVIGSTSLTGTASQRLQVTGGGYFSSNLGIGRTNPSVSLHITGGSAIGAILERNTTGESYIRYQNSSGTIHAGISTNATFWGIGDSTNFTTAPYFVVTNTTGNVGIGTTNPVGQLQVASGPVIIGAATSTGTPNQRLQVTGGAYVSGSVGLGTTIPQYILTVTDTGTPATTGLTNCLADFTTTANSYGQINLRNTSTGANASSDIIVTADNGSDTTNFIDLGINNSGFSVGSWTINGANDGYLYTSDGNLSIGAINASVPKYISFFTGGTLLSNERMRINAIGVGIGSTNPTSRLDVAGDGKFTGIVTATQFTTGSGNLGFTTNTINGPSEIIIDPLPVGVGATSGIVRIRGDLYVDGTQFIVNSTTIELADFNVGIASTVGTLALLDGAGIGIGSANIRKTITWNNTAGALTSSDDWNLASGKQYEINGTSVLTSTTLGTGVTNSSLTSVGILGQLQVTGISTFTNGPVFVGAATSTGTASQRLQVTGGAYVSGNIGAAVTSPSFAVDVSGDARVQSTGKMRFGGTAGTTNFYIQYNSTANSLDFVAG